MDQGLNRAWQLFERSRAQVPAYQKFLRAQHYRPGRGGSKAKFSSVPVSDKQNYIKQFNIFDRLNKSRPLTHISASSGSSGQTTYWPRDFRQEASGAAIHQAILEKAYGLSRKKPTLIVICFSMGVWVAGGFTMSSLEILAEQKHWPLTCVTPGLDKADALNIFRDLAPHFKQVVVCGYPPFLTDLFRQANQAGIPLGPKFFVLASGEKISEDWRKQTFAQLGKQPDDHSIIAVYGSADAGAMAFETPLTVNLRQLALSQPRLYTELFREVSVTPGLYQFDPQSIYFENHGEELLLTADTAAPLIRYNTRDLGEVIWPKQLATILTNAGINKSPWLKLRRRCPWPLVTVKSRSDVAVTFYSLNIYPETIKAALSKPAKLAKHTTGNFFAFTKNRPKGKLSQTLHINLELKAGSSASQELRQIGQESIIRHLTKDNIEFRKLFLNLGHGVWPEVKFTPYDPLKFTGQAQKILAYQNGKKAKIITLKPA